MSNVVKAFEPDEEVARTLGLGVHGPRRRWPWVLGGLGLLIAAIVALVLALRPPMSDRWETEPAGVGDLAVQVTAVGTVQPRKQVDVSFELSGIVEQVAVEINDAVTAGQVLARLDTTLLEAQVAQAQANVSALRAALRQARVSVDASRTEAGRVETLAASGSTSRAEHDRSKTSLQQAVAALGVAEGNLAAAEAGATVARTNLARATLTAPMDGIVLDRHIEPGQAVISSLQAQTLFTVAEDLSHMEVLVEVDEADIGRVHAGQSATFTVAAWPGREFDATVVSVKLSPTVAQQVVTYEATLHTDNADAALVPGMTATVAILAGRTEGALLVANRALRFQPEDAGELARPASGRGRVWVLDGEEPSARELTLGPSDGRHTVVTSGLVEGEPVVLREVPKAERRAP